MGAAAAVAIEIRERHIVAAFRDAGATSVDTARLPQDLNIGMHGAGWRILRNNAAVRDAGGGRFYLDVQSWEAVRRARRRRLLILGVLALAFAYWFLVTRR
jgi:hypothetical protein